MNRIETKPLMPHGSGLYYKDMVYDRAYAELRGGLSWPAIRPGFGVVVGVEIDEDPAFNSRHGYILAEKQTDNVQKLLQWCCDMHREMKVERFFADVGDLAYWELIADFNEARTPLRLQNVRVADLYSLKDPHFFQATLSDIKARMVAGSQTLHMSKECQLLPAALEGFVPEEVIDKPSKHPAIFALCLAYGSVEKRDLSRIYARRAMQQPAAITDYDPLNPPGRGSTTRGGHRIQTLGLQEYAETE